MIFNSVDFMLFFPIVVLIYYIIPYKQRKFWLLVASYYFYMSWNAKYGFLLLFSTFITYISGILLDKIKTNKHKINVSRQMTIVVFACLMINFGLLFYYKYLNFVFSSIRNFCLSIGINFKKNTFDIVLPVGISFFIFQAVGYIIDVYRGDIKAEKNFIQYALFVSFFPQLVAGPIERSKNLLIQLGSKHKFDINNIRSGLLTMAYGFFLKVVVADNLATVIDPAFGVFEENNGNYLLFVLILFAFQIYCDFNGYTKIAIGTAEVLGLKLSKNFDTPYMAVSVKDFWKRWHISLTSWFRDYLYIPLGGNRKGRIRKYINTMIVFLVSGLWHGAAWHYVVWGGINGAFSVLDDLSCTYRANVLKRLGIKRTQFMFTFCERIVTFFLIDFTWLFFRAEDCKSAIDIFQKIIKDFKIEWFVNFNYVWPIGGYETMLIVIPILIVILADILQYMGRNIKALIFNQQIFFRWIIYIGICILILYWGVYGTDYEQTQFIYFQF